MERVICEHWKTCKNFDCPHIVDHFESQRCNQRCDTVNGFPKCIQKSPK